MKTHIYNVYRAAAGTLLLTAILAAACTDSHEPMPTTDDTPREEGRFFSVTASQGGERAETRVNYTPNAAGGMDVTWASGDKIYVGIPPTYGTLSDEILSSLDLATDGIGQTTAQFGGTIADEHLPEDGGDLYAFYGKIDKISISKGNFTYRYEGQRQTANADMTHLAPYDFMIASTTYDATPGAEHNFNFSHAGSMMKFSLGGLGGQKVKKLVLSTYDGKRVFPEGDNSSESVSLDLGSDGSNGFAIADGGTLEAYLMMPKTTEAVGKPLVLYVNTADNKSYATLLTGAAIEAQKIYTISATLAEYVFKGEGTETKPYLIKEAGDLTQLAMMTNSGMMDTAGMHFALTKSIDMTNEEAWVPIGISSTGFRGTFSGATEDGGNHSINLPSGRVVYGANSNESWSGLFGSASGTIKNVTVTGDLTLNDTGGSTTVGGIVGQFTGTIENCVSERNITVTGNIKTYTGIGGIVGYGSNGCKVINCTNGGNVTSARNSGGIVGQAVNNGEITGCTNRGDIESTVTQNPAGGIIGFLELSSKNTKFSLTRYTHNGSQPTQGAPGSIIGRYKINANDSGYSITITDSEGTTTTIDTPGAYGKWPQ